RRCCALKARGYSLAFKSREEAISFINRLLYVAFTYHVTGVTISIENADGRIEVRVEARELA
ncbi:MAG: hypothetical protein DRJ57_01210, partial [Thermoprotei archaeon]